MTRKFHLEYGEQPQSHSWCSYSTFSGSVAATPIKAKDRSITTGFDLVEYKRLILSVAMQKAMLSSCLILSNLVICDIQPVMKKSKVISKSSHMAFVTTQVIRIRYVNPKAGPTDTILRSHVRDRGCKVELQ